MGNVVVVVVAVAVAVLVEPAASLTGTLIVTEATSVDESPLRLAGRLATHCGKGNPGRSRRAERYHRACGAYRIYCERSSRARARGGGIDRSRRCKSIGRSRCIIGKDRTESISDGALNGESRHGC